ncbi:MAG TPA: protein kinase, partial [Sandaracinaceae bacterium]
MTDASTYLLLDRIAVGGMAEVYRAKSLGIEGFEKIVAMKRILPALAEDPEFVAMFVQEAKIAVQLSHANIVPIYELGKIGGAHFIAMEYVWGKDLRQILRRFARIGQPMPPPMAAWIVSKVLEGLDYAHRKRGPDGRPLAIIHRDVSPRNVLVSYDGLVKLIDFGIAKAAGRATQTQAGVIKGKLAYMSPEQVTGQPLDHRSDVFAASALFWELLTGRQLFGGGSDIEVLDRVREARAVPPSTVAPHVPPPLDAVIMKGLARDVNDRWQTAGEMQEAIMRFLVLSRPPYGTSDLSHWMRVAFAPEMAAERAHLERLAAITGPGVRVAAPVEEPEASSEPSAREVRSSYDELSRIVQVEEVEIEVSLPAFDADAARDARAAGAPAAVGSSPSGVGAPVAGAAPLGASPPFVPQLAAPQSVGAASGCAPAEATLACVPGEAACAAIGGVAARGCASGAAPTGVVGGVAPSRRASAATDGWAGIGAPMGGVAAGACAPADAEAA